MIDLNKFDPDKAIKVLQWLKSNNVEMAEVNKLLEIVGTRGPGRPAAIEKPQKKKRNRTDVPPPPPKHDYKAARYAKGFSLETASDLSGVSRGTIQNVETGKSIAKQSTYDKLDKLYGLTEPPTEPI